MLRDKVRRKVINRLQRSFGQGVDAMRQLRVAVAMLIGLLIIGTFGYVLIEGMTVLDALYMTMITLSTIGFGEVQPLSPPGRLFTILVIVSGAGISIVALQNAVQVIAGERLWSTLEEYDVNRRLETIQNHYIICGYGRMGQEVAREFLRRREPFVVVDQNIESREELLAQHIPYVLGDATHDEILIAAGVERAAGVLSVVNGDGDNVLIVLSAKGLNPNLKVVSRAASPEMEGKLRRAGADIVTSPYVIGGQRMAVAMVRPAVYDFLNAVVYSEATHSEMGQLTIGADSPLAGKTLRDSELRSRWGAIVLAVVRPSHDVIVSPTADQALAVGDTLIVVAPTETLKAIHADT